MTIVSGVPSFWHKREVHSNSTSSTSPSILFVVFLIGAVATYAGLFHYFRSPLPRHLWELRLWSLGRRANAGFQRLTSFLRFQGTTSTMANGFQGPSMVDHTYTSPEQSGTSTSETERNLPGLFYIYPYHSGWESDPIWLEQEVDVEAGLRMNQDWPASDVGFQRGIPIISTRRILIPVNSVEPVWDKSGIDRISSRVPPTSCTGREDFKVSSTLPSDLVKARSRDWSFLFERASAPEGRAKEHHYYEGRVDNPYRRKPKHRDLSDF